MAVDRKIYKIPFYKDQQPQWMCPTCSRGVIAGRKGSFVKAETKESEKYHSHPDWEPEWITYGYSSVFDCTNPSCKEVVFGVGTGGVDWVGDSDPEDGTPFQRYFDYFTPKFFIPHLRLFPITESTPKDVRDSINKSFELFFANPSASAGHLRIALEQILDEQKVKKNSISNGERRRISLHKRISLLPAKLSDLKDLFFAIKWLGNDGSHPAGLTIDDVMDAYDIFEIVLDEIYGKKTKKTRILAKKINKARM